ncbi:vesicle-associated membrane protein 7B [Exaiptasia diaphana]|uniref:Vesicle-associated membrane protein 7 n=1 Tax=Exaiptasia diaphana TaxID=2652724 RepID=A0A913XHG6_EXADI|nr:vesicle-associated membrane protein 7B [Exaiptasia diaphana]KXJ26060.1 Vesicle-associated membrane protein 713 [Exaiptasia diaphana]
MPLYYSLIARGTTILVDYAETTGNFQQVAASILEKIPSRDTKCTYLSGSYQFHVIVEDGLVFLCMAEKEFGMMQPYGFLEEIKRRFCNSSLKHRAQHAHAFEFKRDFAQVLASQMTAYSEPEGPTSDNLGKVKREVQDVKNVMTKNIEKVLERGEKIDVLVDKAESLDHSAQTFQRHSSQLRKKMWWQNTRMCLILILLLALIITAIVLIALAVEKKL